MDNLLKQVRENLNMTQETVAQKLNISVNTIQNWERTGKIPKEALHSLLDLYNVNAALRDKIVLQIFGRTNDMNKADDTYNFPDFLFEDRPDIIDSAKKATLTTEEMEIFGYCYYARKINGSNRNHYDGYPYSFLFGYDFFKEHGGYFRTTRLIKKIIQKIGDTDSSSLNDVVYSYGLNHPNQRYSFCSMEPQKIAISLQNLPNLDGDSVDISALYNICKAIDKGVRIGTTKEVCMEEVPGILHEVVHVPYHNSWSHNSLEGSYSLNTDAITSKCICLSKYEFKKADYLEKKEQYLTDQEAYNKHPNLYDHAPSFEYLFEYWLELTPIGKKYIEWIEG